MGRGELFIYHDGPDVGIFQEMDVEGGRLVLPCDVMWCLGSPLLAEDSSSFLLRLCHFWEANGSGIRQITVGGHLGRLEGSLGASAGGELFQRVGQRREQFLFD